MNRAIFPPLQSAVDSGQSLPTAAATKGQSKINFTNFRANSWNLWQKHFRVFRVLFSVAFPIAFGCGFAALGSPADGPLPATG
jgi:hypothetical protein